MFFQLTIFIYFLLKITIYENKLFPFYQYFQHSVINTSHFYLKIKNTGQENAFWWEACFFVWKKWSL